RGQRDRAVEHGDDLPDRPRRLLGPSGLESEPRLQALPQRGALRLRRDALSRRLPVRRHVTLAVGALEPRRGQLEQPPARLDDELAVVLEHGADVLREKQPTQAVRQPNGVAGELVARAEPRLLDDADETFRHDDAKPVAPWHANDDHAVEVPAVAAGRTSSLPHAEGALHMLAAVTRALSRHVPPPGRLSPLEDAPPALVGFAAV